MDPAQLQSFQCAIAGHNKLLLFGAACGGTFTTDAQPVLASRIRDAPLLSTCG